MKVLGWIALGLFGGTVMLGTWAVFIVYMFRFMDWLVG